MKPDTRENVLYFLGVSTINSARRALGERVGTLSDEFFPLPCVVDPVFDPSFFPEGAIRFSLNQQTVTIFGASIQFGHALGKRHFLVCKADMLPHRLTSYDDLRPDLYGLGFTVTPYYDNAIMTHDQQKALGSDSPLFTPQIKGMGGYIDSMAEIVESGEVNLVTV
ncbi:hypothetical protein JW710_02075 [Candidatus Dojkabacteria bacterium]|nr:hypothetical protein [Candidatus Dojkabacteria bacterium]